MLKLQKSINLIRQIGAANFKPKLFNTLFFSILLILDLKPGKKQHQNKYTS